MSTIDLNVVLPVRLASLIRQDGEPLGTVVAPDPRWHTDPVRYPHALQRSAFHLDVLGLDLFLETVDFTTSRHADEILDPRISARYPELRPRQVNTISERLYELVGDAWRLRWRFRSDRGRGQREDRVLAFDRSASVEDPVLIGDLDAFLADLTVVRIALNLGYDRTTKDRFGRNRYDDDGLRDQVIETVVVVDNADVPPL